MKHYFDVAIAIEHGILEAIILEQIAYWVRHNRLNEKNFFNGHYWMYNSIRAFHEQHRYISERKIMKILNDLEKKGLILSGNFNKAGFDKTKWYTLLLDQNEHGDIESIEKSASRPLFSHTTKMVVSILPKVYHRYYQNGTIDTTKSVPSILPNRDNDTTKSVVPIPNIENNIEPLKENNIEIKEGSDLKGTLPAIISPERDLFKEAAEILDFYQEEIRKYNGSRGIAIKAITEPKIQYSGKSVLDLINKKKAIEIIVAYKIQNKESDPKFNPGFIKFFSPGGLWEDFKNVEPRDDFTPLQLWKEFAERNLKTPGEFGYVDWGKHRADHLVFMDRLGVDPDEWMDQDIVLAELTKGV